MESLSTGIVLVLALVAFNNYKAGTLGDWLRAKFFNQDGTSAAVGSSLGGLTQAGGGGGGGSKALATLPQSFTGGALLAPVSNGRVSSSFGPRGTDFHKGLDLAVPDGTPVAAAKAGRVITAGTQSGYGLVVILDHGGGLVTKYGHLSTLGVRVGQDVAAGATIGLSGHTGDATGPHVHFEVLKNGIAVDPAPYLASAGLGAAVSA